MPSVGKKPSLHQRRRFELRLGLSAFGQRLQPRLTSFPSCLVIAPSNLSGQVIRQEPSDRRGSPQWSPQPIDDDAGRAGAGGAEVRAEPIDRHRNNNQGTQRPLECASEGHGVPIRVRNGCTSPETNKGQPLRVRALNVQKLS